MNAVVRECEPNLEEVAALISRGWSLQCPRALAIMTAAMLTEDASIMIALLSTGTPRDLGDDFLMMLSLLFSRARNHPEILEVLIWMRNAGWRLPDVLPSVVEWTHLPFPVLNILFGCENRESSDVAKIWWTPKEFTVDDLNNLLLRFNRTRLTLVEILIRNSSSVRELAAVEAFISANPRFEHLHDRREISARPDL